MSAHNYEQLDSGSSQKKRSSQQISISVKDVVSVDSPPTVSVPGGSFDDSSNYTMSEESLCLGRDVNGKANE